VQTVTVGSHSVESRPRQICEGSRLASRGRTITSAVELPCRSTPMRRGYGSGLTVRGWACERSHAQPKSKKIAGQAWLRYKKVGD